MTANDDGKTGKLTSFSFYFLSVFGADVAILALDSAGLKRASCTQI